MVKKSFLRYDTISLLALAVIVLLWRDQERFALKLIPKCLNAVTSSTEPVGVERGGKLAGLRYCFITFTPGSRLYACMDRTSVPQIL